MTYHQFIQFHNEHETPYGAFEVFYNEADHRNGYEVLAENDGWYWWPCFPGCLPDDEPHGPFPSEKLAYLDAQDGVE